MPKDFNLPPGCTEEDISDPPNTCMACGKPMYNDDSICSRCEARGDDLEVQPHN